MQTARELYRFPVIMPHFEPMTGVTWSHSGHITGVALHANIKGFHLKLVIMPHLELMIGVVWSHVGQITGVALYANS